MRAARSVNQRYNGVAPVTGEAGVVACRQDGCPVPGEDLAWSDNTMVGVPPRRSSMRIRPARVGWATRSAGGAVAVQTEQAIAALVRAVAGVSGFGRAQ